jgi:steroid delta-isomerase-like uncharacterized protein
VTVTRDEIISLLARRLDALQRRDVDALTSLYTADCLVESPMGGSGRGQDSVARVYRAWFAAFPDFTQTFDEPLIDHARVAQLGIGAGVHTGAFMGLAPTSKPFQFPIAHFYTVRDGLIVYERRLYDFTGLLVQLGVLKTKPA